MNATVDKVRIISGHVDTEKKTAWAAVFSLAVKIVGLIAAELFPISLLTPIAKDLHITEGSAGQAITITAIVALFSSLFSAVLTRRIDRRVVNLSIAVMLILSSLLVAFAPNYPILLLGRVLLGIGLGGFWAMAAAIAMRLVPEVFIPKAFSIIFGAGSIASAIAAPLGSYLGNVMGWRDTFLIAAAVGVVALIWQWVAMPSLPPNGETRMRTLVDVLRRPKVGRGMLAVLLVFAGHFAFFTYLRPFLETQTGVGIQGVSTILLLFGLAGFVGNTLAGVLLGKHMRLVLIVAPLLMIVLGIGLIVAGSNVWVAAILIALWGFAFGSVPVAWSTWVSRTIPDQAESGGALLVASIQFAITIGAAVGGLLLDRFSVIGAIAGGIVTLLVAALTIGIGLNPASENERIAMQ